MIVSRSSVINSWSIHCVWAAFCSICAGVVSVTLNNNKGEWIIYFILLIFTSDWTSTTVAFYMWCIILTVNDAVSLSVQY